MFGIFQGILGPIQNAGFGMQKVLDITKSTVLASSALGVDFEQAQRDISLMTRGAAGMDVKLFSLLRATGAIKEDTAAWNKNLTAQERVEKLEKALAKFAKSGEAFGKSWGGVTSTFKGIRQELTRAAFQPVLNTLAANLFKFNNVLIQNRAELMAYFQAFGTVVSNNLQVMIDRSAALFQSIRANWDQILAKIQTAIEMFKTFAPILAGVFVASQAVGALGGIGGALTGALGGGDADEGAGGKKGMGGAITNPFVLLLGPAGLAGLKAAMAALASAIGPVLLAVGLLAGVFMAVQQHWTVLVDIFQTTTAGMLEEIMAFGAALWGFLRPVLKIIGQIWLARLVLAFKVLVPAIRLVIKALTVAFAWLGQFAQAVERKLQPVFDWLFQLFAKLADWIMDQFRAISNWLDLQMPERTAQQNEVYTQRVSNKDKTGFFDQFRNALEDARKDQAAPRLGLGDVPSPRGGTVINNNMQGSRFVIKQEFGDQHAPDKIVRVMMHDLTRQAESRISSGYTPALSR